MPRFYFEVSDGRCSPDATGAYFTDDMAARREAIRRVALLLRATASAHGDTREWKLAVKNEHGTTLFCIDALSGGVRSAGVGDLCEATINP